MSEGKAYKYDPYVVSAITEAISQGSSFDLIHSHVGPLGIPFSRLSPVPIIHTVHEALDLIDEQWLLDRYPEALIASISDSQVCTTPAQRRLNMRTIYHGCDFADYEFSAAHGSYLVFIGRMGPQKNPSGAIDIARKAGMPIILAGQPQDRSEREYFEAEVKPRIDDRFVQYLGPISHKEKVKLLRDAAAMLFPIHWEEHFGIVMIEAMACGTPVIGNRRGSVPEVVDSGITGYYDSEEAKLSSLVSKALALDRRRLYDHAKKRFSHLRMVDNYIKLYRWMLKRKKE
jgi:glycosyltransferase involved in cell wall biosynthesis